jgi:DsbC/DsbD-like thiol-disulfide interchange protein
MLESRLLPVLAVAMIIAAPALAFPASEWHDTHGASIRILTEAQPDGEGKLRGALEIRLEPGWKTYWRDPGDSGIPPTVTVTGNGNVSDPEIGFPPPARFDDGYSRFAGYDESVALALSFPVDDPDGRLDFTAELFLGVCETICIPVQATLRIVPTQATGEYGMVIGKAFGRLPAKDHDGFHARLVEVGEDGLIVEVRLPEGAGNAELFVASTNEHMTGLPYRLDGSGSRFAVPLRNTGDPGTAVRLHYTLVAGGKAVAGLLIEEE